MALEIKTEAWSVSKSIIALLLSMLIAMSVWTFKQQESRISNLEKYAVALDKEKIGKQELREAVDSINARMDAMGSTFTTVQQLHSTNLLNKIEAQQTMLTRLEAHILSPRN